MGKEYNFKICEVGFLAQIFMNSISSLKDSLQKEKQNICQVVFHEAEL